MVQKWMTTQAKKEKAEARRARALRANLRRRKLQMRSGKTTKDSPS